MPDSRQHRGAHPEDAELFAPRFWPAMNRAVAELSWLLSRGYASAAALTLVGDRWQLARRQRLAVLRSACSDEALRQRGLRRVPAAAIRGESLEIDGFNVLTTIEAALAGGVLIVGRDGCCRDMASMHGSYRKVAETRPALERIGDYLAELGAARSRWWLDRPVSNSGRLRRLLEDLAVERGWPWEACLADNPDAELARASGMIATADSAVLDRGGRWYNLAAELLAERLPQVSPIALRGEPP